MHEPCQCCDTALRTMGEPEPTADGSAIVHRLKCPSCQRGGSLYRSPGGGIVGRVGPALEAGSKYRLDDRREPTASVDHSSVATDGGRR